MAKRKSSVRVIESRELAVISTSRVPEAAADGEQTRDDATASEPKPAHRRAAEGSELAAVDERVGQLLQGSQATATTKAHASDWRAWTTWCSRRRVSPLPASPANLARYIADQGERLKPSTLARHLSSISVAHQAKGIDPPPTRDILVRKALEGLKREKGTAPSKKTALRTDEIRAICKALKSDDIDVVRDRALILVGFAAALRRSEIAALRVEDVEFTRKGFILTKRRSKTDQLGAGHRIAVSYGDTESCPVVALRRWINDARLKSGPLFRPIHDGHVHHKRALCGRSVADVIKRRVQLIGLDPSKYAGHSTRSGFITSAAEAGINDRRISKVSGHTTMSVLHGYIQEAELEIDELTRKVGL